MTEQSRCGAMPWLGGCNREAGHDGEHRIDLKDMPVPEDAQRRERLLADLAAEGTARCAYHWTVEAWLQGPCDCKYVPMFVGPAERLRLGEHTGCCEMRAAYRLLAEETRS